MIDGYQHIGRPRFASVEAAIAIAEGNGISKAIVCPYETCPDLHEVHRALTVAPERYRAFGLALGASGAEVDQGVNAQIDAGFDGVRIDIDRILELPSVLDLLGRRACVAMVVGYGGMEKVADQLTQFLETYQSSAIISPHFAGPTDPEIFTRNNKVRELYSHPRFSVVMSRQTLLDQNIIEKWANALIEIVGWDRLIWGSESPVLHWRDETMSEASSWIDRFAPTDAQRSAFLQGNAERLIFSRPRQPIGKLCLPYDPFSFENRCNAPLFPFGFSADTNLSPVKNSECVDFV